MRCPKHGGTGWDEGQCDMCQQETIESARSERERLMANVVAEAAFLQNNPGSYECPACKMVSIKNGASRCPLCQKDLPQQYWEHIREAMEAGIAAEQKMRERMRVLEEKRVAEAIRLRKEEDEQKKKWLASPEYARQVIQERHRKQAVRDFEDYKKYVNACGTGLLWVAFIGSMLLTFYTAFNKIKELLTWTTPEGTVGYPDTFILLVLSGICAIVSAIVVWFVAWHIVPKLEEVVIQRYSRD